MKKILIPVLTLSLFGCSIQQTDETAQLKLCYQNTYGAVEGEQDIEVLWLTVEDNAITGEFHWLPAFKDKRRGTFTGSLTREGTAEVTYVHYQEGQTNTDSLLLTFDQDQATTKGGDIASGLSITLDHIDCAKMTSQ